VPADIVVQILSNGSVVSVDGDFGGVRGKGQAKFATTSHVVESTWDPATGRGAGGMKITGYVLAG
jgi:hypothetical protein